MIISFKNVNNIYRKKRKNKNRDQLVEFSKQNSNESYFVYRISSEISVGSLESNRVLKYLLC